MIAIEPDVADARAGHQAVDPLDHAEPRAQNRDERQLLPADAATHGPLERRVDDRLLEREVARRLVRHEHRDLVDQLLEDLRRSFAIAQNAQLVLDERMRNEAQRRERGGGVHGAQTTNFAPVKESRVPASRPD